MLIESSNIDVEEQVEYSVMPSHPRMPAVETLETQMTEMMVEEPSSALEMANEYMQNDHFQQYQQQNVQQAYIQPHFEQTPCASCGDSHMNYAQPQMYSHNPYHGGYPCPPQPYYQHVYPCPPYPHQHF